MCFFFQIAVWQEQEGNFSKKWLPLCTQSWRPPLIGRKVSSGPSSSSQRRVETTAARQDSLLHNTSFNTLLWESSQHPVTDTEFLQSAKIITQDSVVLFLFFFFLCISSTAVFRHEQEGPNYAHKYLISPICEGGDNQLTPRVSEIVILMLMANILKFNQRVLHLIWVPIHYLSEPTLQKSQKWPRPVSQWDKLPISLLGLW